MPATTTFNANTIRVNNNLEVGLTADISGNVTIHGETTFGGNINNSTGNQIMTFGTGTGATTTFSGDVVVSGNDITFGNATSKITSVSSDQMRYVATSIHSFENSGRKLQLEINELNCLSVGDDSFQHLYLNYHGGDVYIANAGSTFTRTIRPQTDDVFDLGSGSLRWDNIYATNTTISSSDKRMKSDISNSKLGLDFINKLNPVSYRFNDKNRTHYGLISQEVRDVLKSVGVNFNGEKTDGFAGYCYDFIEAKNQKIDDTGKIEVEESEEKDIYSLRYSEFIAPMIKAIQELSTKVTEQQAEIDNLKSQINN